MRHVCWCLVTVAVIFFASSASAQAPMARGFTSYHPYEVAGTFSHVLTDGTYGGATSMNGWTASATANIISLAQVTGEVGAYYGKGIALKSFLAGPQATFHIYRFEPFIHGLFGISHRSINSRSEGNAFTIAAGGGVNFLLTDHIPVRALQMDYYRPSGGIYHNSDFLRVGVGVSYQFGTR